MTTIRKAEIFSILLFLFLSLACLFYPYNTAMVLIRMTALIGLASGLLFFFDAFRKKRSLDLVASIVCLLYFGWALLWWKRDADILRTLFIVYYAIIAAVFYIQTILDLKDHSSDWKAELLLAFFYTCFVVFSSYRLATISHMLALYFFIQACQMGLELYFFSSPYNARYYSFRDWIMLPAWFVSVFPSFVMGHLVEKKMHDENTHFDAKKSEDKPDLIVWIHTGEYGTTLYGHMTFSRDSIMYSYGDYDLAKMKWFKTMGPGIFFSVNDQIYANNCCIVEHCPLFAYGIKLTDEQKQKFEAMKDSILSQTIRWHCPMQEAYFKTGHASLADFEKDYASRLWDRTCAIFRMYTKGQWAWYSLLGNNCSNYSSAMLNEIGLHIPVSKGIVSPGEFFEYFEQAYQDPDSCVISKSWHSAKVPSTLFDTID
ncbi:hypothetical protein [Dubosiella newyorkensis]|uniref:DUF308 domain-containing protein n=1 Tax=Dubosiella newyorkensis TaxID=1862672 RepID=A0A1U7NMD2_9FIRM|nr:hypothetical protein [Dubosiella newyorkensis]OLU46356.1 hypothetical protein BO225_06200 [Dubosiella newyorkensis]